MNILEIDNISKSFGSKKVIVNLNLDIKKGSRVAIMGPNGSGKTTLVNMCLGLQKPTSGEIRYPSHDNEIKDFTHDAGIQFQSGKFPDNFKVKEIIDIIFEQSVDFNYKNYRTWKKDADLKVEEYLKIFKIEKIKNSKVSSISGGEFQRLNILLALISKPRILILDEISSGLDIGSQKQLINFIDQFAKRKDITLIIVSHIIYEIEELVDTIYMLDEGKIMFEKKVKDLQKKYGTLSKAMDKYFVEGVKKM